MQRSGRFQMHPIRIGKNSSNSIIPSFPFQFFVIARKFTTDSLNKLDQNPQPYKKTPNYLFSPLLQP
ncbi:hypothetical protein L1887_36002 [Cichorium endivia]|nr:hypothetical protein L1887_36002 [Cichorium endivia]